MWPDLRTTGIKILIGPWLGRLFTEQEYAAKWALLWG